MKTITLNYNDAHSFVSDNKHRGYFWDGWTIKRWVSNPSGYMSTNGSFKNNRWGMEFSFTVNDGGNWEVKVPVNVEYN